MDAHIAHTPLSVGTTSAFNKSNPKNAKENIQPCIANVWWRMTRE